MEAIEHSLAGKVISFPVTPYDSSSQVLPSGN